MIQRSPDGRTNDSIRPLTIQTGVNRYAEGSVLICSGNTHVLCTVTIEESIPNWLQGSGKGWLTAEYSMLPRSTHTRMRRDRDKTSGRTQEIQRLIGRALRAMIDFKKLGERSLFVDCDVLQADGGTRTAAISGGCVAVITALHKMIENKKIPKDCIIDTVAAVSVGIKQNEILVDLDYPEDSSCEVDMNFVMTGKGHFVEVQGTAEKKPFSQEQLSLMTNASIIAIQRIKKIQEDVISNNTSLKLGSY